MSIVHIKNNFKNLLVVSFMGLFLFSAGAAAKGKSKRAAAPEFSATDIDGKQYKLSDLKGQVVVVNFWATWCGPCLQELPHLNRFYAKLKDQGLIVLAISNDGPGTASRVRTVVTQRGFKMPIIHDKSGSLVAKLNPRGNNPYTIFIDRKGRIAYSHEGYAAGEERKYLKVIKSLLKEGQKKKAENKKHSKSK